MPQQVNILVNILRGNMKGAEEAASRMKEMEDRTKKFTRGFQAQYLSTMFLGFAMQRTFDTISRSSVDAYLKMTRGQTEAAQTLISLSAGMEQLKFSVGDAIGTALEPFLPMILGIVDGLIDWMDQNPGVVAAVIGLGAAIGGTLMVVSMLKLGIDGLLGVLTGLGLSIASGPGIAGLGAGGLPGGFTGLATAVGGTATSMLLLKAAAVILAIAGIYYLTDYLISLATQTPKTKEELELLRLQMEKNHRTMLSNMLDTEQGVKTLYLLRHGEESVTTATIDQQRAILSLELGLTDLDTTSLDYIITQQKNKVAIEKSRNEWETLYGVTLPKTNETFNMTKDTLIVTNSTLAETTKFTDFTTASVKSLGETASDSASRVRELNAALMDYERYSGQSLSGGVGGGGVNTSVGAQNFFINSSGGQFNADQFSREITQNVNLGRNAVIGGLR